MTSMRGALNLLRARMAERRRPIWERTSTPKILSGTNASTATVPGAGAKVKAPNAKKKQNTKESQLDHEFKLME